MLAELLQLLSLRQSAVGFPHMCDRMPRAQSNERFGFNGFFYLFSCVVAVEPGLNLGTLPPAGERPPELFAQL